MEKEKEMELLENSIIDMLWKINEIKLIDEYVGVYMDMTYKVNFKDEYMLISLSAEDLTNANICNFCDDEYVDVSMVDLQFLENYDCDVLSTTFEILELTKNKLKGDN